MRIGGVDPGVAAPGDCGHHEVRQGELVALGGEVAPEVGGRALVVPAGLDVMRQL